MGRIGVFVERYTISSSDEMEALMKFSQVARRMGHTVDYLFRPDMYKIPQYDAIFIRALTDPLNSSYVAARTAQLHGKRVLDDPDSIYICCDKINMYGHLKAAGVPMPETIWLEEDEVTHARAEQLLETMGWPLVLKAPNSSFSMYVDKVETPAEFIKIGRRFLRRSDRIVVQRFVRSEFDWRVGVLDGKPLYVCRYVIPKKRWKILTYTAEGKAINGPVIPVEIDKVDAKLLETAQSAAAAVGGGLYGIDLKQVGDKYLVIEVNDNPTINAGDEDTKAPHIYEDVISFLMSGRN
jgi:glutathione synthase/RimK-type ligase-like ATP-grasp enzyme